MSDILFGRYFTLFEVLVDLLLLLLACVVAGGAVYLVVRRLRHGKSQGDEKTQTEVQPIYDGQHPQVSIDDLISFAAHEFGGNFQYIMEKAKESLKVLGDEPTPLREKQKGIYFAASDMKLHSENILKVFDPEPEELPMDSRWTIKEIVRDVIRLLEPFAESNDVTLTEILDDVERTPLNRDATVCVLRNLIHNAIKFSPGGVVEIRLYLAHDDKDVTKKVIRVDVKDNGKGISEEVKKTLFKLRRRPNGMLEPGSGLGLYCALVVNRRQGGDVQLVESSEKGSTFRAIFPYRGIPEVPK